MGKAKAKAVTAVEVVVKYDLLDLPTAQHKAGLAGLLLQVRHMERTKGNYPEGAIPVIEKMNATSATLRFTSKSVLGLFDAVYDAQWVEVESKSKWPGKRPKRICEVQEEGRGNKTKLYVYDAVQPCGRFLRDQYPRMEANKDWHKLWREMLWAIPRKKPMSRIPFEQRANGKNCQEGKAAWKDLVRMEKGRRKNRASTSEVAGSLWLSAQSKNAEAIPFVGRVEHNLLLHFWPLTVLVFQPQEISRDGDNKFAGYSLAIPEVSDLETFAEEYPMLLTALGTEVRGYRPAEAVIDLPAQGALIFLDQIARITARVVEHSEIRQAISAVDYFHFKEGKNDTKVLGAGRVAYHEGLIRGYRAIVGESNERPRYRNPLFRRGLLLALLDPAQPEWYTPLGSMLIEMPWPFFVRSDESPQKIPWFWQDAAARFEDDAESHRSELRRFQEMAKENPAQTSPGPQTATELLIHRLVRNYLLRKTEDRTGLEWDRIKSKKTPEGRIDVPREWTDAKEDLAKKVFLEMRSRRDQAFVEHFTATFCSVKQFLSEADYQIVATALLAEWEKVKTLTLLSISANS
jgi:CRISPR-associated protein Cmx8